MRKILSLILVCVIITTIFSGCGSADKSANADELNPASSVSLNENQAGELKDKTPYKLYFINEQGKLSSETRYINNTDATKGTEHLATVILKELISGPAKGSLLHASIPQGTTVHSDVIIKDGIATVDLSKEFIDKHQGGKKNEQLTLYSVVNTLTELKEIKSVQFKVDGKVKKEFKGNYQLDITFPRSAYLNSASDEKDVLKLDDNAAKDNKNNDNIKKDNNTKDNNLKDNNTKDSNTKDNNIKDNNTKDGNTKDNNTNDNSTKDQNNNQNKDNSSKDQKTNADVDENGELLE